MKLPQKIHWCFPVLEYLGDVTAGKVKAAGISLPDDSHKSV